MDSPSLQSFNFQQFWVEQAKNHSGFNYLLDDSYLLDEPYSLEEPSPLTDITRQATDDSTHHNMFAIPARKRSATFIAELLGVRPSEYSYEAHRHLITSAIPNRHEAPPMAPITPINHINPMINDNQAHEIKKPKPQRRAPQNKKATPTQIDPKQESPKPAKAARKTTPKKKTTKEKKSKKLSKREEREENYKATKNLTKNFGTAIVSFASSEIAKPYVEEILEREGLDMKSYSDYIAMAKKKTQSINAFRNLILIEDGDSDELIRCKKSLQGVGVCFMKYFSVNWITHGRLSNKLTYLKWRGRILRRIQDPSIFTYLKFQEKKPKIEMKKDQNNDLTIEALPLAGLEAEEDALL